VVGLLLGRELLVQQVFPDAGADLKRALEMYGRGFHGVAVVEAVDDAELARQHLMPVFHEVVADPLLLGGQRREGLGPHRLGHGFPRSLRMSDPVHAARAGTCSAGWTIGSGYSLKRMRNR